MSNVPQSSIMVYREGKWKMINTTELVPGDLCSMKTHLTHSKHNNRDAIVPCDMVLLNGSVVVNEAILTGESTPHPKEPLPFSPTSTVLSIKEHSLHILFGGTKILQHSYSPSISNLPTRKKL